LDGGKILNLLFCYQFNYLRSFSITFVVSILVVLLLIIYNLYNFNFNMLLMTFVMFYKLFDTFQKRYYYYNRFLLERYLHQYDFTKIKNIKSIKEFYRDKKHFINFRREKDVLRQYFQKEKQ
jgi:aminopeptidase N